MFNQYKPAVILLLCHLWQPVIASAQLTYQFTADSMWTWLGGGETGNQNGQYGIKSQQSPSNIPGSRYSHAMAIDSDTGRVYVFGGTGFAESGAVEVTLNDLWKWDPASQQWTFLSGSQAGDAVGSYGTLGVASPLNVPGARAAHAMTFDSKTNRIFMFGGMANNGGSLLNDLWVWNVMMAQWIWSSGDSSPQQPGVYGNRRQSAAGNSPGSRYLHTMVIDERTGLLYVFGGRGMDENGNEGPLNDLWEFNPATSWWVWLGGNRTNGDAGSFGIKNVASTQNRPPARYHHSMMIFDGLIYIFGGISEWPATLLNDLWRYDIDSSVWQWMSGSSSQNTTNSIVVVGSYSSLNVIGARFGHQMSANPTDGSLIVFGGEANHIEAGEWWSWDSATDGWALMRSALASAFGTRGVPSPSSETGKRSKHAMQMDKNTGRLYNFGGWDGTFARNDLWRLELTIQSCPAGSAIIGNQCRKCPVGTFILQNACKSCSLGYYCPDGNVRIACPTLSTTTTVNASSIGDCQCGNGYFLHVDRKQCVLCPPRATCSQQTFKCQAGFALTAAGDGCLPIQPAPAIDAWRSLWMTSPESGVMILLLGWLIFLLIGWLAGFNACRWPATVVVVRKKRRAKQRSAAARDSTRRPTAPKHRNPLMSSLTSANSGKTTASSALSPGGGSTMSPGSSTMSPGGSMISPTITESSAAMATNSSVQTAMTLTVASSNS